MPQPQSKAKAPAGWEPVDDTSAPGWEPVDSSSTQPTSLDFTNNPRREGTYKMVAPNSTGEIKVVDIPYSQVGNAYEAGYKLGKSGDAQRYGNDKFTEINKAGEAVNPNIEYGGVAPTPATFSLPWLHEKANTIMHKSLNLLPTVGGVAGGLAAGGAGLETGPGAIATGAAGAALGGALGEDLRQAATEAIFPNEPKLDAKQSLRDMGIEAAVQGGGELSGRIGAKAISPVAKFFGKTAAESKATGIPMLPSEARGESPSFVENLAKGHVFSSGVMKRFRENQNALTKQTVSELGDKIAKFTGTPEDLGQLVQKGIDAHKAAFRNVQNAAYSAIENQVGEHTVRIPIYSTVKTGVLDASGKPLTRSVISGYESKQVDSIMPSRQKIVDFAKKALSDIEAGQSAAGKAPASRYETLLQGIIDNKSPDTTFRGMREARSEWLSLVRDQNSGLSGKEGGLVKKMAQLADDALEDALKKKSPPLLTAMRNADALTSEEHGMFEQELVKKIVDSKKPEAVATLLRGRATDATVGTGIQETRDIMNIIPQKMHAPIQRQMLLDTMRQSTNRQSGIFNERRFAERIGNIGDERGAVIFGNNWANVKKLVQTLEKVNGPVGMGSGGAALQNTAAIRDLAFGSILAPLALVTGGHVESGLGTAAGMFAFQQGLARALTNPSTTLRMVKALQVGARAIPYGGEVAVAEMGGPKKTLDKVKKEAAKLRGETAMPQVATGSSAGNMGVAPQ